MSSKLVTDLIDANIKAALEKARSVSGVNHSSTRGRLREIALSDLIQPLLPPYWGVATGIICSSDGVISRTQPVSDDQSGQEDILIYDPSLLPPLLLEREQAIIPIEAVLAVVEVKSKLVAADYIQALVHARKIRSMTLTTGNTDHLKPMLSQFAYPSYNLFALTSGLIGGSKTEWDRLVEAHAKFDQVKPLINSLCVADAELHVQDFRITDKVQCLPHEAQHPVSAKLENLLSDVQKKSTKDELNKIIIDVEAYLKSEEVQSLELNENLIEQKSIICTRRWLCQLLDLTKVAHDVRKNKIRSANITSYLF